MQIQTNDLKSSYYLSQQNDMIRLGDVFFSSTKMKKIRYDPANALSQFYSPHYVEMHVPELHQKMVKLKYESENKNIIQSPYKNFRLELVHEYQYCFVQMTLQQAFILKQSNFRLIPEWKAHITLSEDHLWSINFLNLKYLSLSNSQILSIEKLAHCNLPLIEKLQLHQNKITNFSVSSKLLLTRLKHLTLYQNPLIELDRIRCLGAPEMKLMDIDEVVNRTEDHLPRFIALHKGETKIVERVDFIIKSQFFLGLSEFRLSKGQRISCKRYEQAVKQANKNMKYSTQDHEIVLQNRRPPLHNMRMIPGMRPLPIELDHIAQLERQQRGNRFLDRWG